LLAKQKILKFIKWASLLVIIVASFNPLEAQSKKETFRDSVDNAFDLCKFLLELHGYLPIISPITEPALGYGAIGAAVYFIPKKEQQLVFKWGWMWEGNQRIGHSTFMDYLNSI